MAIIGESLEKLENRTPPKNSLYLLLQVQEVLNNLKCLSSTATSIVGTLRTADKEVQTEFPFELLEDYVVSNRKRILKLLGTVYVAAFKIELSRVPMTHWGKNQIFIHILPRI